MLDLVSMQFCIVAYFDLTISIHDHIHEEHRCEAVEENSFPGTNDQLFRSECGKVLCTLQHIVHHCFVGLTFDAIIICITMQQVMRHIGDGCSCLEIE